MPRVLHVIETIAPREGGPPRVVIALVAAQRSMGVHADILCGDHSLLPEYLQYWQSHADGFSPKGVHSARGLVLRGWLQAHLRSYDVVHVHQLWRQVPTLAANAARRMNIPYLIAPHTSLSRWALRQKKMKKAVARRLLWNRIFSGAAGFHALNELEAEEIRDCLGPDGPRVFVVPNGVSLAEFSKEQGAERPAAARDRLTAPDGDRPFILFLARLHTMKGPDLLLDAFASVAGDDPRLQLAYAGPDFGMLQNLQQQAALGKLLDRIHFLGLVSGSERLWLLQNAVCLAQPSRDEGFSLSILEAMACRRPVVISDHCKFPDVERYGAGVIVSLSTADIAAALSLYAHDTVRRVADGRSARLLVERCYTWELVSRQAEQMYLQAIGRHP
jgi:glycosyltransferase involved in cell wall biosynthesis